MKLAVTSHTDTLESPLDPCFGRARYFIAVNNETGAFPATNITANLNAAQVADIRPARLVGSVQPPATRLRRQQRWELYPGSSVTRVRRT